ncbi:unnamed protein product [Oppiella nova]|uniref:Uncharacterized protein n=1 Tax=Oppiella nova TaxID=334625 RepID=A0A7R9QPV7_9ACAR|nr:unnamed protein product [Oppiella nova]CAG2169395.1 unnamed protein product [Oppiella nova]
MSDSSDDDESPGYDIDPEQRDEAILCLVKLHSILAIGREQHDIKLAQERSLLDQSYDDSGIATGDNSIFQV